MKAEGGPKKDKTSERREGDMRVLEGGARQIAARKKVNDTNVREVRRDEWGEQDGKDRSIKLWASKGAPE
jgi:hypothetical protein